MQSSKGKLYFTILVKKVPPLTNPPKISPTPTPILSSLHSFYLPPFPQPYAFLSHSYILSFLLHFYIITGRLPSFHIPDYTQHLVALGLHSLLGTFSILSQLQQLSELVRDVVEVVREGLFNLIPVGDIKGVVSLEQGPIYPQPLPKPPPHALGQGHLLPTVKLAQGFSCQVLGESSLKNLSFGPKSRIINVAWMTQIQ